MGFEQFFDNLTFKRMDALRNQIQSVVDLLKLLILDTCDGKHILTIIVRIKLLYESCLVCSDINERYYITYPSFTLIFVVFCITSNLGVSCFSCRIILIFGSSQLNESQIDLQDSDL